MDRTAMLYRTPPLSDHDHDVIAAVHAMRAELAETLRVRRRWQGGLRRASQARAVQGSSSIEGYVVSTADAAAAATATSRCRPAGPALTEALEPVRRSRAPLEDPYPGLLDEAVGG